MRPPLISLLTLPCAGASATAMYLRWQNLLPQWVRVVPVELPGRGSRLIEPRVEDFDQLVAQLCEEHAPTMQGAYAFWGHSMGALLAYGMAQRQRARCRGMPRALFVSGSAAPSRRDGRRFASKGDDVSLIADLRKQGGTPEAVFESEELMRMVLDAMAADYRVCASYRHPLCAPLPMPLTVFCGRQDDIAADRVEAWRLEAGGRFELKWFEGGHFFIREHEHALLAAVVRELMHPFSGVEPPPLAAA